MKALLCTPLLLAAGLLAARAAEPATAAAHWEGRLQLDATHELDMVLDLAPGPQGGWIGTVGFPKSTARDVPLEAIKVEGRAVQFTAHVPDAATFSATLATDASSLEGTAANEQGEAPFQLKRNGAANVKLPPPSSPLAQEFAGAWEGTIENNGQPRTVGLKLSAGPDGLANAVLSVVAKRRQEFVATTVTTRDRELRLEIRSVSGTYAGTLGAGGEIAGEWSQGPNRLPLTFKRAAADAPKS